MYTGGSLGPCITAEVHHGILGLVGVALDSWEWGKCAFYDQLKSDVLPQLSTFSNLRMLRKQHTKQFMEIKSKIFNFKV